MPSKKESLTLTYRVYLRQLYDVTPKFDSILAQINRWFPPTSYVVRSSPREDYKSPILEPSQPPKDGKIILILSQSDKSAQFYLIREQIFTITPRGDQFPEDILSTIDLGRFAVATLSVIYDADFEAI